MRADVSRKLAFFIWAVAFGTLCKFALPDSSLGNFVWVVAMWAGFYPLAATMIPIGRYWAMLAVLAPAWLAVSGVDLPQPLLLVNGLFAVALIWFVVKKMRRRGQHSA